MWIWRLWQKTKIWNLRDKNNLYYEDGRRWLGQTDGFRAMLRLDSTSARGVYCDDGATGDCEQHTHYPTDANTFQSFAGCGGY